jgi:HAD superfamily hydrolase (TIGR01450 family)
MTDRTSDGTDGAEGKETAPTRTAPAGSERRLDQAYDTALLDLDGVVYRGGHAVPHAVESLATAREHGMQLAYVTNNASRTPDAVANHLTELGIPATEEDVITSAQAVARLIADQVPAGAPVLAIGGDGLFAALRERGLRVVDSADEDGLAAAVQGYDPDLSWRQLAEITFAVNRGVPWFASNTDLTIPTARGIAPGNGTLVQAVRLATGAEVQAAGKPLPPMHRETVIRTGAERPLVVGDRLDTDIEGAYAGGVDSLAVLTGVVQPAELLAARPDHRPTYVAADLRGLLTPMPEVTAGADGEARCGGWTARAGGDALTVEGDGDPLDGLRALCGAAWAAAGDGTCGLDAGKALARLGW